MKYMYALLLVLAGSPALASVYLTKAAADEGVARGATELFTRGVGFLDLEVGDKVINANGILISPTKLLTAKHVLLDHKWDSAAVIFYPDIVEFNKHCRENRGLPFHGKPVTDIGSSLLYDSIVAHPFLDLAIITLKHALPGVACTPLLLRDPKEPTMSGFLTSYSPSYVLESEKPHTEGKRHISILTNVKEESIPGLEGKYWTKTWDIPEGVDAANPANRIFSPLKDEHRLVAYSLKSDSGAPFVVKMGKDLMVAGLHKGKVILPRAPEDTAAGRSAAAGAGAGAVSASSADAVKHHIVVSYMVPLYLAADWIEANR